MASVPRTIRVGIEAPAQTVTYSLPPGLAQFVQSVYAEVDTSGSGDTTPSLSISEQAGVPIAVIPQDTTLDGGSSGRATWALRLAGSGGGSTPATSDLLYDFTLTSDQRAIDTAVDGPMAGVLSDGYAALGWRAVLRSDEAATGTGSNVQLIVDDDTTAGHYAYTNLEWFGVTAGSPAGGPTNNNFWTWRIPGAASTAKYFGQANGTLEAYADAVDRFRTGQLWSGDVQVTTAVTGFDNFVFGVWKDTTAIDRLAVRAQGGTVNLVAGSRFSVFGLGKL